MLRLPYEAAAWAVIRHRIRITQAAAITEHIAGRYGAHLTVAGAPLVGFPAPRAAGGGGHREETTHEITRGPTASRPA